MTRYNFVSAAAPGHPRRVYRVCVAGDVIGYIESASAYKTADSRRYAGNWNARRLENGVWVACGTAGTRVAAADLLWALQ